MKWSLNLVIARFSLVMLAVTSAVGQGIVSVTSDTQWHGSSVDNAYMNRQIADAAEQYKEYAPIPRIGFYDIGFPKDKIELQDMNGYAVLLVSALSQESNELPIKRAYVSVSGKDIELKKLKEIKIRNTELASQTVKTFGQYRVDALYLLPVHLRLGKGQLLIDFTKNRVGLKLAEFDGSVPDDLKRLPEMKPDDKKSFEDALKRFMKREYPGYYDN
jgi:hypothetical protein